MPIHRMRRPAEDIDVCDTPRWDGTLEHLADFAELSGQDLYLNPDGSVTVQLAYGPDVMWPGWVLYKDADGRLGLLGGHAADDLQDLPAA